MNIYAPRDKIQLTIVQYTIKVIYGLIQFNLLTNIWETLQTSTK